MNPSTQKKLLRHKRHVKTRNLRHNVCQPAYRLIFTHSGVWYSGPTFKDMSSVSSYLEELESIRVLGDREILSGKILDKRGKCIHKICGYHPHGPSMYSASKL
jgi:hypothetical protein